MPCTIAQLLKKLDNYFPNAFIGISAHAYVHRVSRRTEVEYIILIDDEDKTYNQTCDSLKHLREYVESITEPKTHEVLTINQLAKIWGQEGGTELRVE